LIEAQNKSRRVTLYACSPLRVTLCILHSNEAHTGDKRMTNTQSMASIDRQIIQAMRLQGKGCEGAQELIDRLFDARNEAAKVAV
jgi:hypothetical protein